MRSRSTKIMATFFIDYTPLYFREVVGSPVPHSVSGKFVRIRNDSADYLVFSPKEFTKFHSNIVERFCLAKGIEGSYDAEGKRFDIADMAWTVAGGGKYEIDRDKKTIKVYDTSMAYGAFDREWIRETLRAVPEFSGFAVQTA